MVKFLYLKNIYEIKGRKDNLISEIIVKYMINISNDIKNFYFLYKGKKINLENKLKIKDLNNDDNIIILVYNLKPNKKSQKSSNIICPECNNLALINIYDNKISTKNCINKHEILNLSIHNFIDFQINQQLHIECCVCHNNRNLYNDEFYICSCKNYVCGLCFKKHNNPSHNLLKYNYRYYKCFNHNVEFISYCKKCNINLCEKCEEKHSNHEIILYKKIMSNNIKEKKTILNNNILKINKCKKELKLLVNIFNMYIDDYNENLDKYLELNNIMINSLEKLKNYEAIQNIINFKLEKLDKDINYLLSEDVKQKFMYLIDKYNNKKNQIKLIYKINKNVTNNKTIKLFGENFVENNKNNCYLKINNEFNKICVYYNIEHKRNEDTLEIELIESTKIYNLSYMFSKCNSLLMNYLYLHLD